MHEYFEDPEIAFGYVYAVVVFCGFLFLMWKMLMSPQPPGNAKKKLTVANTTGVVAISVLVGGMMWFLLWLISFGWVRHGLWGLGIAIAGLILIYSIDAFGRSAK